MATDPADRLPQDSPKLDRDDRSHLLRHQHSSPTMSTPRAYNNFSSAYTRSGTANSRITVFGNEDSPSHPYAQVQQQQQQQQQQYAARQRMPSDSLSTLRPPPPESRVFGLTPDLKEPSPTVGADEIGNVTRMSSLLNNQKPCFSVEVFAPSFDHRGYPVLSGRAASVRGVVRMSSHQPGCDVMMTISAHTTSGSPAAVWQGVALAPWSTGTEKKVFEISDRLAAPSASDPAAPVLSIPFDVNLPMGQSTRFVDGEAQSVPVALPPSFEISSKAAQQEKRDLRLATKGKSRGPLAKELLEKGFEKVYRIGCYYQITWTLLRDNAQDKSFSKKSKATAANAAKEPAQGDSLTLPFVFLGEPTSMAAHPPTLPSTISPTVFLENGTTLGDQWDVHKTQAKWSGDLLRSSRKTVDVELHIPAPLVLQSPSVLPIMVVLRPADPNLLSAIGTRSNGESATAPTSPLAGQLEDPIEFMATHPRNDSTSDETESIKTSRSIMSKLMKPTMGLARVSGSTTSSRKAGSSSIFGSRRPKTAPSPGSSETGVSDALTDKTYMPQGSIPDLVSLLCVSLLQTAFSSNDNVNDGPEHRRKLLSFADLEEVEVGALLLNSDLSSTSSTASGSRPNSRPGSSRSPQELTAIQEAVAAAKASGLRVLVGSLKVAGTTVPSFRCQGLEVKYALKLDLLPANRTGGGGGGGDGLNSALRNLRMGRNDSDDFSSIHTQTQSGSLSNNAASPPSTPPWQTHSSPFGGSTAVGSETGTPSRPWIRQTPSSRLGSPSGPTAPPAQYGIGISSTDDPLGPTSSGSNLDSPPLPQHQPIGVHQASRSAGTPFGFGGQTMSSAASSRTGWGSGTSVFSVFSDASGIQSSIYLSEWGRDRKIVTKINKSIGEMWLDVRVVRGHMLY